MRESVYAREISSLMEAGERVCAGLWRQFMVLGAGDVLLLHLRQVCVCKGESSRARARASEREQKR